MSYICVTKNYKVMTATGNIKDTLKEHLDCMDFDDDDLDTIAKAVQKNLGISNHDDYPDWS